MCVCVVHMWSGEKSRTGKALRQHYVYTYNVDVHRYNVHEQAMGNNVQHVVRIMEYMYKSIHTYRLES